MQIFAYTRLWSDSGASSLYRSTPVVYLWALVRVFLFERFPGRLDRLDHYYYTTVWATTLATFFSCNNIIIVIEAES